MADNNFLSSLGDLAKLSQTIKDNHDDKEFAAIPVDHQDVQRLFHSDIAEKFFDVDAINAIFDEYVGGNSDNWRKVCTIYTFLVWYEEYFVKR